MARTATRRRIARRAFAAAAAALALPAGAAAAATPETTRVSDAPGGLAANSDSERALLSGDGRIVAFNSWASDLVPGDTNGTGDAFVRDRLTGVTQRVDVASDGTQPAPPPNQSFGPSFLSGLSADGQVVAFQTDMPLVPEDTNRITDVYVRDLRAGTTSRVSVGSGGTQGDRLSGGGSLSADGRRVVFFSAARNLVPGDRNRLADVFVHDRRTGRTRLVSVARGGRSPGDNATLLASISGDGRTVAFVSSAANLVKGDTNGVADVFVRDLRRGRTTRVDVSSGEAQAAAPDVVRPRNSDVGETPVLSADGRYVAFASGAPNLVKADRNRDWDVFLRDRVRGTTTRTSVSRTGGDARHRPVAGEPDGRAPSSSPSISADGRFVAFHSDAFNLTRRDPSPWTDVFIRDRRTRTTTRVPSAGEAVQAPALSADGRWIAFDSGADDLLPGDANSASDVFVRGPLR
jgi:Tol biopolymer transport system component